MCLIIKILSKTEAVLTVSEFKVLSQICKSILTCSGKITMLEISRYTKVVYRTIQRFFEKQTIQWSRLNFLLFSFFVWNKDKTFLLAGDETVEPKSGKKTYGLSKFFSNIQKRTLPSIALMTISLIDTENKKSYPIATKQVIKPKKENKKKQKSVVWKAKKRKPGRPKGSKNKAKDPTKDILYQLLDTLLRIVNSLFISCLGNLPCVYLTLDGYFGNQHYMRLAKKHSLHLISKLKYNSALYLPFEGQYNGNGRPNKYGTKINVKKPDNKYFVGTKTEKKFKYDFYQIQVWSRKYIDAKLNVVIIICKNLKTGKTKNCILFSTDLNLSYDKIIQYYSLRFQIEFNFRDAKQYFGLADFKNYKEIQLTNAINLSFFMCNLTYILSNNFKEQFGLKKASILDLKTYYRTEYIANKTYKLKIKEKKTVQFLNPLQIFNIAKNQAVNF